LYGITKLTSERLWQRLSRLHELSAACVRIAQPYGPMERVTESRAVTSPIHDWVTASRAGRPLRLPAWPAGKDWTYVRDTAQGIAALATADRLAHPIYHVGCGRTWMVGEVIEALRRLHPDIDVHVETNHDTVNRNIQPGGLKGPLSVNRIRQELGFAPRYDLFAGLVEYENWLQGHP
jgi:UDP-glucose 4-epimerase